jgi:hypothetical protein
LICICLFPVQPSLDPRLYGNSDDILNFLARYRDASTAKGDRASNWGKLARKTANRLQEDASGSRKSEPYDQATKAPRITIPAKHSLLNEMTMLARGYQEKKELWILEHVKKTLEKIDPDPEYRPLHQADKMRLLAGNIENLDSAAAMCLQCSCKRDGQI